MSLIILVFGPLYVCVFSSAFENFLFVFKFSVCHTLIANLIISSVSLTGCVIRGCGTTSKPGNWDFPGVSVVSKLSANGFDP